MSHDPQTQYQTPQPLSAAERQLALRLFEQQHAYEVHQYELWQKHQKRKLRKNWLMWTAFWGFALLCTTAVAQAQNLTSIPGMMHVLEWRGAYLPVMPRMDVAVVAHMVAWWFCVVDER